MVITTESNGIQIKQYSGKVLIHKIPTTLEGDLVLPQRVTHIQKTSFTGCSQIATITLQDHVREINSDAFDHCTNLEKIIVSRDNKRFESDLKGVLFTKGREWLVRAPKRLSGIYIVPNGVKHIDKNAFKDCENITTLMLAQTVTTIDHGAFENCTGLLHMIIPPNVTQIKSGAFIGCSQLCGVTVASDNRSYVSEEGALFNKDKTELLYVPATLSGQQGKKDGRYQVPEGVTYIAPKAFWGCKKIVELVLSDTLEDIGNNAFEGCQGLTRVYAPVGIDWEPFDDCNNLQKRYIRDPQGLIYNKDTNLIEVVWKDIVCANILPGIKKVEPKTFVNRVQLRIVSIPYGFADIGEAAFMGCKNLTEFQVPREHEAFYTDEHGVLFQKLNQNVVLQRAPTNLAGNYRVPDGVTHIVSYAFESCPKLEKVTIPKSVWSIRPQAFVNCPNVTISREI